MCVHGHLILSQQLYEESLIVATTQKRTLKPELLHKSAKVMQLINNTLWFQPMCVSLNSKLTIYYTGCLTRTGLTSYRSCVT